MINMCVFKFFVQNFSKSNKRPSQNMKYSSSESWQVLPITILSYLVKDCNGVGSLHKLDQTGMLIW